MRTIPAKTEKALEDIQGALCGFYEEGDDADPVRVALDALAALAAGKSKLGGKVPDLVQVLGRLQAGQEIVKIVEGLYELAEAGEYGSGLSKEQAEDLNEAVDERGGDLIGLIRRSLLASPTKREALGRTSRRTT